MPRMPTTSRWVLAGAGLLWVGLVAAAAWIGSADGILPDVLATILGTAAGLAFAATGLAAYGERRRRRRQREDFQHVVVSHLRVAFRTTNRLAHILVELTAVHGGTLADAWLRQRLADLLSPNAHEVAPGVARTLRDVVRGGSFMESPEERYVRVRAQAQTVTELAPGDPDREHNLFVLRLYQLVTYGQSDTSGGQRLQDAAMTDVIRHCSASVGALIDLLLSQLELLADYQFDALAALEGWRAELRARLDLWQVELLEPEGERSTWLRGTTADILETVTDLSGALSVASRDLFAHMATKGFKGVVDSFLGRTELISGELQKRTFDTIDRDLMFLWDRERLPPLT